MHTTGERIATTMQNAKIPRMIAMIVENIALKFLFILFVANIILFLD